MVEDKEVISAIVPSAVALAALLLIVLGLLLTQLAVSRQAEDQGLNGSALSSVPRRVIYAIIINLTFLIIQALIVSAMGTLSLWDGVEFDGDWAVSFFLWTLLYTGIFTMVVVGLVLARLRT